MAKLAVIPGSFNPVTRGHLDVIVRATKLFERVQVVVVHNPEKQGLISIADRVSLLVESLSAEGIRVQRERPGESAEAAGADALAAGVDSGIVGVVSVAELSSGLLVEHCQRVNADVIVKGVRSQLDLAYEQPMALMNREMTGIETLFLLPDPAYAHISSTLVRQIAASEQSLDPG